MTLIQPKKRNTQHLWVIASLAVCLLGATAWFIVVYNGYVAMRFAESQKVSETKKVEAQNAEIKDRIFSMLNEANKDDFASAHQLVKETQPRYIVADSNQRWEVALHF